METELTQERLRAMLLYDPETGAIRWIVGPANRRDLDGALAATTGERPRVRIGDVLYRASRLAWFYMTGAWPTAMVDHKDGNPLNNRWANLRLADESLNGQNQRRAHRDSKTGLLGVFPKRDKFAAQITTPDGRRHTLGSFKTAEAAHAAYIEAKRKLHEGCTI